MLCLVSTRLERWSRQADIPFAAVVAALAIGLFSASWAILHVGFFTHHPVKDTPLYQRYGTQIVDGEVPYRDVRLEYPPGALPFFRRPRDRRPVGRDVRAPLRVDDALLRRRSRGADGGRAYEPRRLVRRE
jgi:hypothetical protein